MSVYRYELIESGSKRISRGITLSWSQNRIRVAARMEVSGEAATDDFVRRIRLGIEYKWGVSFDEGYSIDTSVDIIRTEDGGTDPDRSQIYITNDSSASFVEYRLGLYYATMHLHMGTARIAVTPAHEFGHMLGLGDRYEESIFSNLGNRMTSDLPPMLRIERNTTTPPEWQGNIMAESTGRVSKRNLQDLQSKHMMRMVTVVEDYYRDLDHSIRQLYRQSYFSLSR